MSFDNDLRAGLVNAVRELGIASQADLARRWGVTRQRVWQHSREPGFPRPVAVVNGKPVFVIAEADAWRRDRTMILARAKFDAVTGGADAREAWMAATDGH